MEPWGVVPASNGGASAVQAVSLQASWVSIFDSGCAFSLVAPLLTAAPEVALVFPNSNFSLLRDALAQVISQ